MADTQQLEVAVVQLRKENRELRAERENLLVKNRLLTEVLGKQKKDLEPKESQKDHNHSSKPNPSLSSNSLLDNEIRRAEREISDLKDQVEQLKEAISRVRQQNETLEDEKDELMAELDKAAENEINLEAKVTQAEEEKEFYIKELEEFKESLRALFPASKNQSDLQGYLEYIEKRIQENADQEKYLDRREKLIEERTNSLNLREASLREKEILLEERAKEKPSSKMSPQDAPEYNPNLGSSLSRRGGESLQNSNPGHRELHHNPSRGEQEYNQETLKESMVSGRDSYFETAREKARKKREQTDLGQSENRYMRASESLSQMPTSGVHHSSVSHQNLANTLGANGSSRLKQSSYVDKKESRVVSIDDDEKDPNKLTFNPSRVSQYDRKSDQKNSQLIASNMHFEKSRTPIDSQIDPYNQKLSVSTSSKKNEPIFDYANNPSDLQDQMLTGQFKNVNKWQKKEAPPMLYEADKDIWHEHEDDDEMETGHNEKNINHQPNEADFQLPPNPLQEQTMMESKVESQLKPAGFNPPIDSQIKKAVAFDLFDESIDEKKRQILIQKLEKNRAQDKTAFQKNNFLTDKREEKKDYGKQKDQGLSSHLAGYEKQGNGSGISKAGSGITSNQSHQGKNINRELSPNNENQSDAHSKPVERRNPSSQGRKLHNDKPPIQTSPYIPGKK